MTGSVSSARFTTRRSTGRAGAEIMTALYDLQPEPTISEPVEVPAEHIPSSVELLSYAAVSKFKRATDAVPLITRTARSGFEPGRKRSSTRADPTARFR